MRNVAALRRTRHSRKNVALLAASAAFALALPIQGDRAMPSRDPTEGERVHAWLYGLDPSPRGSTPRVGPVFAGTAFP